jgi:hypothetical protein
MQEFETAALLKLAKTRSSKVLLCIVKAQENKRRFGSPHP